MTTGSTGSEQSARTVVVAFLVNVSVAVAKLVAGLVAASAAMLSEAAHSFADTITELLLFVAVRRGIRPADARRPFGYGRESYVWAFLAAIFTFVTGAGFSITHGFHTIRSARDSGDYFVSYVVLAVSFLLESVSLARTVRQVRSRAGRWRISPARLVRNTPNTPIKAVFFEDTAALIGLLLAGAGLGLSEVTGDPAWDGVASIAIGVLLFVVAWTLAGSNVSLLVGRAAADAVQAEIRRELDTLPQVQRIVEVLTLQLGPDDILVATKVDFPDDISGAEVEAVAEAAERHLMDRNPAIRFVFVHPTGAGPGPG